MKWIFLALRLKNFLYFTTPSSNSFLEKISYAFSGKKTTLKKFPLFQQMELSTIKLKNFLYFCRQLAKPEKQKFLIFLQKGSLLFWDDC